VKAVTSQLQRRGISRVRSDVASFLCRLRLHPGQEKMLNRISISGKRSHHTTVLAAGRRWGKTLVCAVDMLMYALFVPNSRQCITSISLDQASIAFTYILSMLEQNHLLRSLVRSIRYSPFPELTFRNGSSITTRSTSGKGKYLRGHSFHRILCDEAEYIEPAVLEEVVYMSLADVGGELMLVTTPRQWGSFVHRLYQSGDDHIYRQTGTAFDNPYIDRSYIERLQSQMSNEVWRREVLGEWVVSSTAFFAFPYIQQAYFDGDWSIPEEPNLTHRYVAGWDLARKEDWTVGIVLDIQERPVRVVDFYRTRNTDWQEIAEQIRYRHHKYRCMASLIDATGLGDVVLSLVADVAQGFVFTSETKAQVLYNLQVILQRGDIRFPFIRELVDELANYALDDKKLQTDCVFALALACWAGYRVTARILSEKDIAVIPR